MTDKARQICFVDMPFGEKPDPRTGQTIYFDQIFEDAIKPAIEAAGLDPIRGDQEETGGIIHKAMFARLLLAEFVIADMTTANPNVFYELGVRHTARPFTTIPIFATIGAPPFDVNMVRAIPYDLEDGRIGADAAQALSEAISVRIDRALHGPLAEDSPLFSLFPAFPGIEMSHELTDVFRDRVDYSEQLRDRLAEARERRPLAEAEAAIAAIADEIGTPSRMERGVLIDIFLSYRAVEAYDRMIALYDDMPAEVRAAAICRQQLAFALNRRNGPGDRKKAIRVLEDLVEEQGESAETLGILGRIHKDRYKAAKADNPRAARGMLREAIAAYTAGFEAEPLDYYPGINAITLLLVEGSDASVAEMDRLAPLVAFAALRKGGAEASDYWTVATVLELSAISGDFDRANTCLDRVLGFADRTDQEPWMYKTTADNLALLIGLRADHPDAPALRDIHAALVEAAG